MAQEFSQVTAEIIEGNEFPELSNRYGVSGVPKTIINDRVEFVGAVPEAQFVAAIQQAVPAAKDGAAPA